MPAMSTSAERYNGKSDVPSRAGLAAEPAEVPTEQATSLPQACSGDGLHSLTPGAAQIHRLLSSHSEIASSPLHIEDSLEQWQHALARAGLLEQVMAASLGPLTRHGCEAPHTLMLAAGVPACDWPLLGMRAHIERERASLNRLHGHDQQGGRCHRAAPRPGYHFRCVTSGRHAPFADWLTFWCASGIHPLIRAVLAGHGRCRAPGSVPQCGVEAAQVVERYRVAHFAPRNSLPRGRPEGAWRDSGSVEKTRDRFDLSYRAASDLLAKHIDAVNWLLDGELAQVHNQAALPFTLIEQALSVPGRSDGLSRLFINDADFAGGSAGAHRVHVMGLLLTRDDARSVDQASTRDIPQSEARSVLTWDVLTPAQIESLPLEKMDQHRMPGVQPSTWIVNNTRPAKPPIASQPATGRLNVSVHLGADHPPAPCSARERLEQDAGRLDLISGTHLLSMAGPADLIINRWLNQVSRTIGLPGHRSSFRIAKLRNETLLGMVADASGFALPAPYPVSEPSAKIASCFRMPLDSIVSTHLSLHGHDNGLTGSKRDVLPALFAAVRKLPDRAGQQSEDLASWLLFDDLTGTLTNNLYRFQVLQTAFGLLLAPLPFWQVPRIDGVQTSAPGCPQSQKCHPTWACAIDTSTLAHHAQCENAPLSRLLSRALREIQRTGALLLRQIEAGDPYGFVSSGVFDPYTQALDHEFRIAESVVVHALSNCEATQQ
ncbi:hypothetical protein SSTU70S_05715 [Stutzerimonas stutzeri]